MATHTREDYLAHRCTHREYYAQFVSQWLRDLVIHSIGLDRILKSTDEHFNDIPLPDWDNVIGPCPLGIARAMRERGDYPTLAGMVCLAKEAAQQVRELHAAAQAQQQADESTMAIRTRTKQQREFEEQHPEAARLQRKADQCDELASLALQDGDQADALRQFAKAKELRQKVTALLNQ